MKTKQQVWDEFVDHYFIQNNPFGYDRFHDRCKYSLGCAIGRYLPQKFARRLDNLASPLIFFKRHTLKTICRYIDIQFSKETVSFLVFLQNTHDCLSTNKELPLYFEKKLVWYGITADILNLENLIRKKLRKENNV